MTPPAQPERNMDGFSAFAEAFSMGWNARGDLADRPTGEAYMNLVAAAFERSGARLAHRVLAGELSEAEAMALLEERSRGL